MPAIPELMSKIWDGDDNEYFTFIDMNRVEYNANICAKYAGVGTADFLVTTREGQFRYDEAQKLENLIKAIGAKLGVSVSTESMWGYNRTVSYVDFERWESNTWNLYKALGGVGERIQAGTVLVNYHSTLFASEWMGSGPFYIDLEMPAAYHDTEALFYVSHTASVDARMAEYNGVFTATVPTDRVLRVYANGIKPTVDVPIVLSVGGLSMYEEITVKESDWTGDGPYTAVVTLSGAPVNATLGAWEGMSNAAIEAMTNGIISVSAINGTKVTLRCLGDKPTVTINPIVMWDGERYE